nr:uncharacterized protein LOC128685819 [Cherax quadricarinatus]
MLVYGNWARLMRLLACAVWGCTAQQMWLLTRHGTRFPTQTDMGRMMNVLPSLSQQIEVNHRQGRGCLNEEDLSQLGSWFPPYGPRDKEQLHEIGYDELFSIGEYWRDMFPHLYNVTYDPARFKVDFTVKNRTGSECISRPQRHVWEKSSFGNKNFLNHITPTSFEIK